MIIINIIAVDDEKLGLSALERAIKKAVVNPMLTTFLSANDALDYARENTVDVAFLDIMMSSMNGLILAKRLKEICGKTNIIFVTAHGNYAIDAFEVRASGYIVKPVDADWVRAELENLRSPVKIQGKGLWVQCFGNFEVFMDGQPVSFSRSKAKEAFAYLIDREGASVSKKELAGVLWEDASYSHSVQSHLFAIISDITSSLQRAGAGNILIKKRGSYAIDTGAVGCDLYEYQKSGNTAASRFRGEYMSNYSWAEFTAAKLDKSIVRVR